MLNKFFDIKPYDRNEVYLAVGKLIENAQKFEEEYKECLVAYNVKLKKNNNDSLFDCNDKMLKKKLITERQHFILAKIAYYRNEINHSFFINNLDSCKTEEDWTNINTYLNTIMDLIFEGRDIIANKINESKKFYSPAPTVFDKFLKK